MNKQIEAFAKITVQVFIVGITLGVFFQLFTYHKWIVHFPYQLEWREAAPIPVLKSFLNHQDPYALQLQPQQTYIYGFLYPFVSLPIIHSIGLKLQGLRYISGLFIFMSLVLIYLFVYRDKMSVLLSVSSLILMYSALLYDVIPYARPDGLGLFLLLSSFYAAWNWKFHPAGLLISSLLGILAFYTKVYFFISVPVISLYLFLFVSKKKGLAYGAVSFILIFLSALVVRHFFETYFNQIFLSLTSSLHNNWNYCIRQVEFLFISFWSPLAIIACVLIFYSARFIILKIKIAEGSKNRLMEFLLKTLPNLFLLKNKNDPPKKNELKLDVIHLNNPLINRDFDFFVFILLIDSFIMLFSMGQNDGVWMAYFYELILPFLIISVSRLKYQFKYTLAAEFLLSLIFLFNSFYFYQKFLYPIQKLSSSISLWKPIENQFQQGIQVLCPMQLTALQIAHNGDILDSGLSEYFLNLKFNKNILNKLMPWLFIEENRLKERNEEFKQEIKNKINDQFYDKIFTPADSPPFFVQELTNHYQNKGSFLLVTPRSQAAVLVLLLFEPKNETSDRIAVYISQNGIVLKAGFQKKEVIVRMKDGKSFTLPLALSASGARYSDGTNTFWEHQGSAVFMEGESIIFEGKLK